MPPATNSVPTSNNRTFEKLVLVLLFIITVTQFSSFGYQSVTYILGSIFNVPVISTPLDVAIGLTAMIASVMVFLASALCWVLRPSAQKYMTIGAGLFVVKNMFDLVNETILFSMKTAVVSMEQIQQLASILGGQFFELAFWVMVLFYFRYVHQKRNAS